MKKIEDLNFYELLEVSPQASAQEIHRAYERVRRIYEPNSLALYSLFTPEETAVIHQRIEEAYRTLVYEDNRRRYDAQLRERDGLDMPEPEPPVAPPTYQARPIQPTLALHTENRYVSGFDASLQPTAPVSPPAAKPAPHETAPASVPPPLTITEFTGPVIKALREQNGLTVRNIADTTKVGTRYLEYIEEENFSKLPARAYVRGFLILYAKALGYEPDRMINDFLKRFDAAITKRK